LIKNIKDLANNLKKKTVEHEDFIEEANLERNESDDMLKQIIASVDASIEDTVRKKRAEAREQLAMETSQLDVIRQLSRQLKIAEDVLRERDVGAKYTSASAISAPTSSPLPTPFVTPTPLSSHIAIVDHLNPSPTAARDEVVTTSNPHIPQTRGVEVEYIDAVDAGNSITYIRQLTIYLQLKIYN
jgi:hypothetical protein